MPLSEIVQLVEDSLKCNTKLDFAKKVALNLFNFMQSFNTNSNSQYITVTADIFNKWYEKFMTKYKYDPNFVYQSQE